MKNVLVIGGSYFVGKVFVEALARNPDYRVVVANRGNRPLGLEGVEEIVCDRNQTAVLRESLPSLPWEAVVDFCGYTPKDVRSVVLALPRGSVGHYIFISTTTVYAPTLSLPIRENGTKLSGPQPELGPAAGYGFQKWLAEQTVSTHARQLGFPCTCLRPSIIYGAHNYAPRERYFFERIDQNQIVVLPDNDLALFQFVSVWDVAKIITLSMGNPETFGKAFNLSAEELISYKRFVEVLEAITGTSIPTRTMPVPEIDAKGIPLPFPLDTHLIYSGDLVRRTLGFQYTSFTAGMQKTYDWYQRSKPHSE
jgi:nucleoside-diphosphate-sugar epimerase